MSRFYKFLAILLLMSSPLRADLEPLPSKLGIELRDGEKGGGGVAVASVSRLKWYPVSYLDSSRSIFMHPKTYRMLLTLSEDSLTYLCIRGTLERATVLRTPNNRVAFQLQGGRLIYLRLSPSLSRY